MKILIISLLFSISLNVIGQKAVELKTRPLNKDIKKRFKHTEYQKKIIPADELTHRMGVYYTLSSGDTTFGYLYAGRVNSCRTGGCSIEQTDVNDGSFEYFDYYVLFNLKKEVVNVRVFNYQATHGQEVSAQSWLKQFRGYDGDTELQVGKNIDAISGATISVYAITVDIEHISKTLKQLKTIF